MPNPNPRMLDEPGVMDRLYYISKSLKVPESELLDAMDRAMKADPELDAEYSTQELPRETVESALTMDV